MGVSADASQPNLALGTTGKAAIRARRAEIIGLTLRTNRTLRGDGSLRRAETLRVPSQRLINAVTGQVKCYFTSPVMRLCLKIRVSYDSYDSSLAGRPEMNSMAWPAGCRVTHLNVTA